MLGLGLGLSRSGFVAESLLLDTYSGAAAAYSLRKLSSTYTSSAIRVRESATNTEADIGFNADGSLDTTSLLAHTGANDGFVTTWYDQSGNGNDATQGSAAAQPKIVDAGVLVTENGKPAIKPDGVDDILFSTNSSINYNSIFTTLTPASSPANNVLLSIGLYLGIERDKYIYRSNLFLPNTFTTQNANQQLASIIAEGIADPRDVYAYRNSLAANNNPVSLNLGSDFTDIFGRNTASYDGIVQEIIIYPTDQSANRTAIEANINDYYNIY